MDSRIAGSTCKKEECFPLFFCILIYTMVERVCPILLISVILEVTELCTVTILCIHGIMWLIFPALALNNDYV